MIIDYLFVNRVLIEGFVADDKDCLSIKVAYIKVNISRSRKTSVARNKTELGAEPIFLIVEDKLAYNKVRFSILADIGSTSFVYDMRNIKEVFIFPKIWYRRSLARRLFLGEENAVPQPQMNSPKQTRQSPESNNNTQDLQRRKKFIFLSIAVY